MMKLKVGTRGEIVIPKKIREYLGLTKGREIILEIKGKKAEIKPQEEDVIKNMKKRAERIGNEASNWKTGDELYEEVF